MDDNRNMILAIGLSLAILIGWQFFVGMPQMEKQREALKQQQQQQQQAQTQPAPQPGQAPGSPQTSGGIQPGTVSREQALAASPRIAIETPRIKGSIALKGARIDDVSLVDYHETVDPKSPNIVLLSPSGSRDPFYAEFGWVNDAGTPVKLPTADTVWNTVGTAALTPERPLVLTWDNGEGLRFKRTISVDPIYMFTITDEVGNTGASPVTIRSFGLASRHGMPQVQGYYILHEGPVGVLGDGKLFEPSYKDIEKPMERVESRGGGWLGITDKYWAATLIPDQTKSFSGSFSSGTIGTTRTYQADFLREATTVPAGGTTSVQNRLFAGAKEVAVVGINFPLGVGGYNQQLGINHKI